MITHTKMLDVEDKSVLVLISCSELSDLDVEVTDFRHLKTSHIWFICCDYEKKKT